MKNSPCLQKLEKAWVQQQRPVQPKIHKEKSFKSKQIKFVKKKRLQASTAGDDPGLSPGQGTKLPYAKQPKQKQKKLETELLSVSQRCPFLSSGFHTSVLAA